MGRRDRSSGDGAGYLEPAAEPRSGKSKSRSAPAEAAAEEDEADAKPIKYSWKAKLLNVEPVDEPAEEEEEEQEYEEQEEEEQPKRNRRGRRSSRPHRFSSEDGQAAAAAVATDDDLTSKPSRKGKSTLSILKRSILGGKSRSAEPGGKRDKKKVALAEEEPGEYFYDEGEGEEEYEGGEGDEDEFGNDRSQSSKAALQEGAKRDRSKPLGWSFFQRRDASEGPASWAEVDERELK